MQAHCGEHSGVKLSSYQPEESWEGDDGACDEHRGVKLWCAALLTHLLLTLPQATPRLKQGRLRDVGKTERT
jgi:hypothetical protein